MENSHPLATESFSYSWLTQPESPTILIPSPSHENQHNFNFDVPITTSQPSLVHADEIFSHGHIIPVYTDTLNPSPFKPPISIHPSPVSSQLPLPTTSFVDDKSHVIKWRKSSKRILNKCFKYACKAMGFSRKNNRVNNIERRAFEVQTWNDDTEASPRPSSAHSVVEWVDVMKIGRSVDLCHGLTRINSWGSSLQLHSSPNISPCHPSDECWDSENSIREAILYCKRTIEK